MGKCYSEVYKIHRQKKLVQRRAGDPSYRGDLIGQIWLAPWPKCWPLPRPLYPLPIQASAASLRGPPTSCPGFGLQLFILSVWGPSFLLNADSDKEQCSWHLISCCTTVKICFITPTAPPGRLLLHHFCLTECPVEEHGITQLCSANPVDSHSQRFRPLSPGCHHKPSCPCAGKVSSARQRTDEKEQNLSFGNSEASKFGFDLKHKRHWWNRGQEDDKLTCILENFNAFLLTPIWHVVNSKTLATLQSKARQPIPDP